MTTGCALNVPPEKLEGVFDAVLFDFSGTLFDDGAVITPSGVSRQAAARGVALDEAEAERVIERALTRVDSPEGLAAREGSDLSAARHRAVWTRLITEAGVSALLANAVYATLADPASWPPYPDTAEALAGVHAAGVKIGVVSNIGFDIRPTFAAIGAEDLVTTFVLSCERGSVKPDPELFAAALAEVGTEPGRTLFVGDDPVRDGAAVACGVPVYLLPRERRWDRPRGLEAVVRLSAS